MGMLANYAVRRGQSIGEGSESMGKFSRSDSWRVCGAEEVAHSLLVHEGF
jgi:hypothetical protein